MTEKDLIIVYADGLVRCHVVTKRAPADTHDLVAPFSHASNAVLQFGMFAEGLPVPVCIMRFEGKSYKLLCSDFSRLFVSRLCASTNTRVIG
jgi:hypothetical protein